MEDGYSREMGPNSLKFARTMVDMALMMGIPVSDILDGLGLGLAPRQFDGRAVEALDAEHLGRLGSRLAVLLARYSSMAEGRAPIRPPDWQVVLYCLLSGRTLRDAILHASDAFQAMDGRCGRIALHENGGIAEVRIDSLRLAPTLVGCAVDLNGVASIHGLLGWLLGRSLPLRSIQLAYEGDLYARLGLGDLPYPLVIAAPWTGFSFAAAWLDHPVIRSMLELGDRRSRSFLFEIDADALGLPLPERVRRFAIQTLRTTSRLPSFAEVAIYLGSSEPTLRRHLAGHGISYRLIKASCRRELGLELLRQPLSVEDIAARLDFCDADAFRGAFRAWFGKPPAVYRRELKAADMPL